MCSTKTDTETLPCQTATQSFLHCPAVKCEQLALGLAQTLPCSVQTTTAKSLMLLLACTCSQKGKKQCSPSSKQTHISCTTSMIEPTEPDLTRKEGDGSFARTQVSRDLALEKAFLNLYCTYNNLSSFR